MNIVRNKWAKLVGIMFGILSGLIYAQNTREIVFYHGTTPHPVEVLPYTNPPFVRLDQILHAIGMDVAIPLSGSARLSVNHWPLELDVTAHEARFKGTSAPLPLRNKQGVYFVRVDALSRILSELLGRVLIYESTSKTMHLPETRDLSVTVRFRKVGDDYRLVLIYSQGIGPATVDQNGRNLLVKIPASPVIWDQASFVPNEAVTDIELYENLPDQSTEVLFKVGEKTKKFQVLPFTPDNPRTAIIFSGDYSEENYAAILSDTAFDTGIKRIVIDPGHGGVDRGAVGPTGLQEKDVTLELARMLQSVLEREGSYEVKLTRKDDTLLSLKARTGIANNTKADLFISIHVNAIPSQNARGSETYYLSLNAGDDYDNPHYEGYSEAEEDREEEQDDELKMMLWDLAQNKHIDDSFRIARYIQQELNLLAGIRNRGVKQAPLKVLKGAAMPAVLIEVAFISNGQEEARLKNPDFKQKIVQAMNRAITRYGEDVVKRSKPEPELPAKEGPIPW